MPGLFGFVGSRDVDAAGILSRMTRALMHGEYQTAEATGRRSALGCVHHGLFDHRLTASTADELVSVMLDGWLFDWKADSDAKDAAQYCLDCYLQGGLGFVRVLNGQFNLAIQDDRTARAYLINDRYGTRPLQYAETDGTLYFAPEAKAILAGNRKAPVLNMDMVVNQLSWGRIWIGEETFFEGVRFLPPSSVLRWEGGDVTIEKYWEYRYNSDSTDPAELVRETVDAFRVAVARQACVHQPIGVSLSGGLDSRALVAALGQAKVPDLNCYTWGVTDANDEIRIARQVAQTLALPWQFVPLAPADFIVHAGRGTFLSEGLDLFVQSYGLAVYPAIASKSRVLLTGLALDVTLGGSYLHPSVASGDATSMDAFGWALAKSGYFSEDECMGMMRPPGVRDILDRLKANALAIWREGGAAHPADQCDRFFLRTRVWRNVFFRQMWQRLFLEDISPTFDNVLIDCLLRIPPTLRLEHRFYQKFLSFLAPEMCEIPYQRTMLPASAPIEFWAAGAKIEQQREKLYRDIWHATGGKIFVPYTRFYTNFDEWLRRDPHWMALTDDLLLGNESRICATLVHRESIENLVADHRAARGSHYQKIIQLMGLELMMRQFFDSYR